MLRSHVGHESRHRVPQPFLPPPDNSRTRHGIQDTLFKTLVPFETGFFLPGSDSLLARFQSHDHGDGAGDVFGTRAPTFFLRATEDKRVKAVGEVRGPFPAVLRAAVDRPFGKAFDEPG